MNNNSSTCRFLIYHNKFKSWNLTSFPFYASDQYCWSYYTTDMDLPLEYDTLVNPEQTPKQIEVYLP